MGIAGGSGSRLSILFGIDTSLVPRDQAGESGEWRGVGGNLCVPEFDGAVFGCFDGRFL